MLEALKVPLLIIVVPVYVLLPDRVTVPDVDLVKAMPVPPRIALIDPL